MRHFNPFHGLSKGSYLKSRKGFTLIEFAIAAGLLIIAMGLFTYKGISFWHDYQNSIEAGAILKQVRQAQRAFILDHKDLTYSDITGSNYTTFLTYCPNGELPTLPTLNGSTPSIDVTVFPPVAKVGGGVVPNGNGTDGKWNSGP